MGKSLEWLGDEERRRIAESLLEAVDTARSRGNELWAACPFHVEESPGGAFSYNWREDSCHCLSCGESGDLISIYNAVNGREPSNSEGFVEFRKRFAPHVESGKPRRPQPRPVRREVRQQREWTPRPLREVPAEWSERAESFVSHAEQRLQASPDLLRQLRGWGVTPEAAKACRIGWNDKDKYPTATAWGLPPETNDRGKPKKLFLPQGLVLPMVHEGRVVNIKIRRPAADADPRYVGVRGGSFQYHVYGRPTYRVWVLVETERDGAFGWQELHGLGIGCMATGSASARPDEYAAGILRGADVILNALDTDQAGAVNTYRFWENEFPQSVRWPVPSRFGKDLGDMAGRGDVRAWALAGLPGWARRGLENAQQESDPVQRNRELLERVLPQWPEREMYLEYFDLPEGSMDSEVPEGTAGRGEFLELWRMLRTCPLWFVQSPSREVVDLTGAAGWVERNRQEFARAHQLFLASFQLCVDLLPATMGPVTEMSDGGAR